MMIEYVRVVVEHIKNSIYMKTLKSIAITLTIVVSAAVISFAQVANVVAEFNSEANQIFVMTSKYMKEYPREAYGYIYGKNALNEFLKIKDLEKVYVFNALDKDGMNRIVFKAGNKNGEVLSTTDPYDEAKTCPPFCPKTRIAETGRAISEDLAVNLIESFQNTYASREKAQLFDRSSFEKVLAQEGAEGVYLGHGLNNRDEQVMILVGVDAGGNIMWNGVVINDSTPIPALQNLGYPSSNLVAKN
jgi:hypothetical protein